MEEQLLKNVQSPTFYRSRQVAGSGPGVPQTGHHQLHIGDSPGGPLHLRRAHLTPCKNAQSMESKGKVIYLQNQQ